MHSVGTLSPTFRSAPAPNFIRHLFVIGLPYPKVIRAEKAIQHPLLRSCPQGSVPNSLFRFCLCSSSSLKAAAVRMTFILLSRICRRLSQDYLARRRVRQGRSSSTVTPDTEASLRSETPRNAQRVGEGSRAEASWRGGMTGSTARPWHPCVCPRPERPLAGMSV